MTIAVGDFIDPYKDTLRFARDHCEELERQRDEARKLCDFNAKQLLVAINERNSLVVQRDRLMEALKSLLKNAENKAVYISMLEYTERFDSEGNAVAEYSFEMDNARAAIAEVEGSR